MCGASVATAEQARLAYQCGELLAQRGVTVVNGGLGGVMAACAQGVRDRGGTCVGLLPGDDSDDADAAVTIALATGLGELRNALIARVSDGLIAIGGGWGTLSEVAFAMRIGRRVALLDSWELRAPGGEQASPLLHRAAEPGDAVAWVLSDAR